MDDEHSSPRLAIDLSSERVKYHQDTVEYLLNAEIARCASEGIPLSNNEINNFRTQLVKTLIIKHQAENAVNMRIKEKK